MIESVWLITLGIGTDIGSVELKKSPVLKRHVLNYAEQHSGESGFLWFDDEVGESSWSSAVADKWQRVELPDVHSPVGSYKVLLLVACCLALMRVPIRTPQQSHLPDVVQQEFESVAEEVALSMRWLKNPIQRLKHGRKPEDIEDGMSVGNTLRTLDDLSQEIEQRRQEAMESVTDAMVGLSKETSSNCPSHSILCGNKI